MPSRSIDLVTHAQSSEYTRRIDALEEKISENTREIDKKILENNREIHRMISENNREIDRKISENNRQIAEVLRIVSQIEHRLARGVVNPIFEQDRGNRAVGNEDGKRIL